jgi:hypothetical protein
LKMQILMSSTLPMDCYLGVAEGLVPLPCEEGRPKAVRGKVAGKGQQQTYWTEAVQVTNRWQTRPLVKGGARHRYKTINVKQKLISSHETQMGLETKTYWPTGHRS